MKTHKTLWQPYVISQKRNVTLPKVAYGETNITRKLKYEKNQDKPVDFCKEQTDK